MEVKPLLENGAPVLLTCTHLGDHPEAPLSRYGFSAPIGDEEITELKNELARKMEAMSVLVDSEIDPDSLGEFLEDIEPTLLADDPFVICWN